MLVIPIVTAAVALMLMPFRSRFGAVAALLGLLGLTVAVIQLAVVPGSTVGGLLLDASSFLNTFVASAALAPPAAFPTIRLIREYTP